MTAPTISIVTVCRNAAATIAATIDSVISQKTGAVEYIVVDGASDDGTREIVESYGESIDRFVCEPDAGISDAFNKGIQFASGKIVGLINADDVLLPGVLQKVMTFFSRNPETAVIHGDVVLCSCGCTLKRIRPAGRWWYPWRLVLFNHPATFVRREVYERYGLFDTTYEIAMDVEIFLRWMRKGVRIAYLPEVMVAMQSGGASGRRALHGYREVRRALLVHRFPAIPATIQYVARYGLQAVVLIQEKLRSLKRVA